VPIFYTLQRFLSSSFLRKNGLWGPLLPEILGKSDPVGAKTPIFNRYSLVATQP